jgi:hypothetical protein
MKRKGISYMKSRNRKKSEEVEVQTHTHEFLGSTKLAEEGDDRHNHRFAGVTSEVIPIKKGKHKHDHKHAILVNTDFFGHLHEVGVETGPAIDVGHGKHVHLVTGMTTVDDEHFHEFIFATLIESPLLPLADEEDSSDESKDKSDDSDSSDESKDKSDDSDDKSDDSDNSHKSHKHHKKHCS